MTTTEYYVVKTISGHKYLYWIQQTYLGPLEKQPPEVLKKLEKQKRKPRKVA